MRALLKTGEWVDIDTKCLFENQYNTTEECGNKRIFDGQIQKIENDARVGKGKCKYCGAEIRGSAFGFSSPLYGCGENI